MHVTQYTLCRVGEPEHHWLNRLTNSTGYKWYSPLELFGVIYNVLSTTTGEIRLGCVEAQVICSMLQLEQRPVNSIKTLESSKRKRDKQAGRGARAASSASHDASVAVSGTGDTGKA